MHGSFQRITRRGLMMTAMVAIIGITSTGTNALAQTQTIGVSIPTLDNPFWVNATKFAQHAADELGVKLVVVGAENREEKQLADVQSLIAAGANALVVTPQSTASAPGIIALAKRANLPIVIVDRYPGFPADNPDAPYVAFVGPNDVTAGRDVAKFLIDHGAKKIVGLGGTPGSSVAEGRQQGLDEQIKASPGVELVQYVGAGESEDAGYQAMQNLLAAHAPGTIDSVWCFNDGLCLGAFRAIKQAGRDSEIKLAGIDLVAQALDLIENKTNYTFSTGGHWLQVGFGVMIAYDTLNGHKPISTDIRLDMLGVNSDNFAAFKQQFIDNPPPYAVKDYTITNNPGTKAQTFPLQTK
ncbi:MAG: substrate-binding domain-containing protein [Rhizobiaceae bacterium]|nr:substrate-binding domain-containing protein [Rhizobiaceae bacterium]